MRSHIFQVVANQLQTGYLNGKASTDRFDGLRFKSWKVLQALTNMSGLSIKVELFYSKSARDKRRGRSNRMRQKLSLQGARENKTEV